MIVEKIVGGMALVGVVFAQAAPVDPWTQLASTCVCGCILGWMVAKTIPAMAREHREAVDGLAKSLDGQTEAMRERDQKLITLLSQKRDN